MVSVHNFGEIWIIDHSTTTEQAASHSGGNKGQGGDILYRWGNPQVYRAGSSSDQKLFGQHDARWIDSGNPGYGDILIFDNGMGRIDGKYSTVEEITTPFDSNGNYFLDASGKYGPDASTWNYEAQPVSSFFAQNISGATRLPNGNTLICEGPNGKFFEIDSNGKIVWEYINPVTKDGVLTQGENPDGNPVFKIYRYSPDYSGLSGKDLSRKGKIENTATGIGSNDNPIPQNFTLEQNYPNPFNPSTTLSQRGDEGGFVTLKIYDSLGKEVQTLVNRQQSPGSYKVKFDASGLPSGIYFYTLKTNGYSLTKKMILLK